jgi:hypothetical protein
VTEQQKPKLRILDNGDVVESYANKFVGSFFDGSAVGLTFGAIRLIPEKTNEGPKPGQQLVVHITHRLTLSPSAAIELISSLNTVLTALTQAQGTPQQLGQPE